MTKIPTPQIRPTFTHKLLSTAIALTMLGGAGQSIAQAPEVEEVVVTGSFIRRSEGIAAASPITQLSAEDLQSILDTLQNRQWNDQMNAVDVKESQFLREGETWLQRETVALGDVGKS